VLLPGGDASQGLATFETFGCHGCHAVAHAPGLPAPVSDTPGPVLGSEETKSISLMAQSILTPEHDIARRSTREARDEIARSGSSPMTRYSDIMTLRELADVIEFLLTPLP